MDFSLSDEQRLLRDEIRRFARRELNGDVAERDRQQLFPRELWGKCGEMRLPGLAVPEEYGGGGLDSVTTAVALEALGYGSEDGGLVFSLAAHLLACAVAVWTFGSEEQRRRWLPGLSDGTLVAANAMSEPGSGSDAFALSTRAERAEPPGDGFRLHGSKTFVTNGPVADLVLVFALTDPEKGYHGGVTAFLVERGTPGLRIGPKMEKMGLRTSPIGELAFDGAEVGAAAVLGEVGGGAGVFVRAMEWERACLAAIHVGAMERLLEKAVDYARTREQYGQRIGKFQGVSHRIAEMKVRLEAARLLVYKAAWQLERSRAASLDAAVAKLYTSESLVRSALDAVQVLGGYGFMTELGVERAARDAVGSTLYSGTSEIQKNIIARWLGL